jgi:hypothetical protein
VPQGVTLADASTIISQREKDTFFSEFPGLFAQFSDLFRYEMLARHGGWWVDTDVVCLTSSMPAGTTWIASGGRNGRVYNSIMHFPAGHPLMLSASDAAYRRLGTLEKSPRTAIGPDLLTELNKEFDVPVHGRESCYKVASNRSVEFGEPDCAEKLSHELKSCPMLHWWAERFRAAKSSLDLLPPERSYLAQLFQRHGAIAPYLSVDEWRELVDRGSKAHKLNKAALTQKPGFVQRATRKAAALLSYYRHKLLILYG